MIVRVKPYEDKYGKRLVTDFGYNPDLQAILKSELGFPAFKFHMDLKKWSILDDKTTIEKAVTTLASMGYDCKELYDCAKIAPKQQPSHKGCNVLVSGPRLIVSWPFIPDASLRGEVLAAIKSIPGRKFHADRKCWSIPLAQSQVLHGAVEFLYAPLSEAIMAVPEVSQTVEASVERIEMSGAATLSIEADLELTKRLEHELPPHLDLYPFQKVGVAFAEASEGKCLIGDDMGLGKTIQALAYMALHRGDRPTVVVSPANVKYNWAKEIKTWLPGERVQIINKGKDELEDADIFVINYDLMTKQAPALNKINPRLMILDEGHYLKSSKAQRTIATLGMASFCPKVLVLSGTAIGSRPKEYFNVLHLLKPQLFPSRYDFHHQYCDPYHNGFGWDFNGASNTKELNERARDVVIRRLKKEVLTELPDKVRTFLPVQIEGAARKKYDIAQDEWDIQMDEQFITGSSLEPGAILSMISKLRHICGRMKVPYAKEWIDSYRHHTGKPIVIFGHHRDVIEELVMSLKDTYRVGSITGATPAKRRQEQVEAFQDGQLDMLVCNTLAAKEGLTLTAADTVLFIEREWVPTDEEQAEDRVYRIGQESDSVHAVYLSCVGTIDEHFDRVVEQKRQVVKAVLDGGDVEERQSLVKELVERMRQERA
jgi:SNF2 family DNA or RNA helicase